MKKNFVQLGCDLRLEKKKKKKSIQSGLVLFGVDSRSPKSLNLFVYLNYFVGTLTNKSSQSSGKLSSSCLVSIA